MTFCQDQTSSSWVDGVLVSSSASKGHPSHMHKLANSNSAFPNALSQLKGRRELGCLGQYGNSGRSEPRATFVMDPLWQRLSLRRDGRSQGQWEPSLAAPPKTALPSRWGQHAEAIPRGSPLPRASPRQTPGQMQPPQKNHLTRALQENHQKLFSQFPAFSHNGGNRVLGRNPGVEFSYNGSLGLYSRVLLSRDSWHDKTTSCWISSHACTYDAVIPQIIQKTFLF